MDAIRLLKEDHATVRKLLGELNQTTERAAKTRTELLARIQKELEVHTTIEEEIFYPAFRDAGGKEGATMVAEAFEEHRAADELVLPDLLDTEVQTIEFSGRAKVLKELIEHHADEEEKEMFPQAREVLAKKEMEKLGEQMLERKKRLQQEA